MTEPVVAEVLAKRSREHWFAFALCTLAPLGLVAMRFLLTPASQGYGTHEQLGLPACQAINWFGIPCPGCGVTTSVTWFAHGYAWQSFVAQPFGFALAAGAALSLPYALLRTAFGADMGGDLRRLGNRTLWISIVAVVALAWIYKIVVVLNA